MDNHTEQISRWQRLRTRLSHPFRLVVMDQETFQEVRSFNLSLGNVYLALSSLIVVVAALVFAAIVYTPLKRNLPGFENLVARDQLASLNSQINDMEKDLADKDEYIQAVQKLLLGKYQSAAEAAAAIDTSQLVEFDPEDEVPLSPEEIELRREMELESVGASAREGGNNGGTVYNVPLEQLYYVAPIRGEISGTFNPQKNHNGVDVIAAKGTAVKSIMDGYIVLSDYTYETGHTVAIQHDNGIITFYKHNSELLKKVGDFVKAGEAVAIIGNSGHQTTGPHLHFEFWHRGRALDPTRYIKF